MLLSLLSGRGRRQRHCAVVALSVSSLSGQGEEERVGRDLVVARWVRMWRCEWMQCRCQDDGRNGGPSSLGCRRAGGQGWWWKGNLKGVTLSLQGEDGVGVVRAGERARAHRCRWCRVVGGRMRASSSLRHHVRVRGVVRGTGCVRRVRTQMHCCCYIWCGVRGGG